MTDASSGALATVRELLFADLPPLTVIERFADAPDVHALASAVAREDEPASRELLERILGSTTESRTRLQAWALARRVDIAPSPEDAGHARGVVIDVGMDGGTDTLAAYDDGTARYLNQGGGAIVWEASEPGIDASIRTLLATGQLVADRTGPLDGPRPPVPPAGFAALWVLTDGGIHLGLGPFQALAADPVAGPLIVAGTDLMRLLIERQAESTREQPGS